MVYSPIYLTFLALCVSIISLVVSLLNYLHLEKQRKCIFEIRLIGKVRKKLTGEGFELVIMNKSDFDITFISLKIIKDKILLFEKLKNIYIQKNLERIINLKSIKTHESFYLDMQPSEEVFCLIKALTRSKYLGKKKILLECAN
jgi:hypothetical protein